MNVTLIVCLIVSASQFFIIDWYLVFVLYNYCFESTQDRHRSNRDRPYPSIGFSHGKIYSLTDRHSHTAWELTYYVPYACGHLVNRSKAQVGQGLEGREWKETRGWQKIVLGTHRWAGTQTSDSPLRLLVRVMCMTCRCEGPKV